MAFLDNSNDITIDSVLTDIGREKLARNDGSFRVVAYSFSDDEIDYTQFDPTTGSAFVDTKILQTVLFEACVNEKINFNYPLITITNPNLKYLPTLVPDNSAVSVGEEKGLNAGVTVRFYQSTNQNAKLVPVEIQDGAFRIEMSNELLQVENESPVDISPYGTGIYILQRDAQLIQASQGSQLTFKVRPQSLSNSTWDALGVSGSAGAKRTISTKIKATGINSGLSAQVSITIQEEFNR